MAEQADDFDDARYQHHLQHRGVTNHIIFWTAWILVASVLCICSMRRFLMRLRIKRSHRHEIRRDQTAYSSIGAAASRPSRIAPSVSFTQISTLLSTCSSLSLCSWLQKALPSYTLGRLVIAGVYLMIVSMVLLFVGAPFMSQHFIDDMAFRAAWTTITQIPLVYLLAMKNGPINMLASLSYNRINWFHRWAGRTLFVCATIHAAIMKSSISTEDILLSDDYSMSVVRYGIGAYSTLVWIVITSILPLRRWSYRIFYINHYITTFGFLLIAVQHVPSYARTAIYMALGFVAFDKGLSAVNFIRLNFSVMPEQQRGLRYRRALARGKLIAGYQIEMVAPPLSTLAVSVKAKEQTTVIRLLKVPLTWRPGQHVRLYIPALGAFEVHPFTPANASTIPPPPLPPRRDIENHGGLMPPKQKSDMLFTIRAHSGLTSRLLEYNSRWLANPCPNSSQAEKHLVGFIEGLYGKPPMWEDFDTLILIGASTGVSFILSIMDFLEQMCFAGKHCPRTRRVRFIWVVRHCQPQLEQMIEDLLSRYSTILEDNDIKVKAEFYTTCPKSHNLEELTRFDPFAHLRRSKSRTLFQRPPLTIRNPEEIYSEWDREAMKQTKLFKQMNISVTDLDSAESFTFEGDEASDNDTLVDESSDDGQEDDPFDDAHATDNHDDAYRPMPSPIPERHEETGSGQSNNEECQCTIIQHQRRKLQPVSKKSNPIQKHFGARPDIKEMISGAFDHDEDSSTMVAVCANGSVAREARIGVATMKQQAARRRSRSTIDIFVEGMG